MAHFYGTLKGNRGEVTRCGSANSGVTSYNASWKGAVRVHLFVDESGNDCYRVEQTTWQGHGVNSLIGEGVIGDE